MFRFRHPRKKSSSSVSKISNLSPSRARALIVCGAIAAVLPPVPVHRPGDPGATLNNAHAEQSILSMLFGTAAYAGRRKHDRGNSDDLDDQVRHMQNEAREGEREREDRDREQQRQERDREREQQAQERQQRDAEREQQRQERDREHEQQAQEREQRNNEREHGNNPRTESSNGGRSTETVEYNRDANKSEGGKHDDASQDGDRQEDVKHEGAGQDDGKHHVGNQGDGQHANGNSGGQSGTPVTGRPVATSNSGPVAAGSVSDIDVDEPPATVEKWLKQLIQPKEEKPQRGKPGKPEPTVQVKSPKSSPVDIKAGLDLEQLGRPELLVVNATAKTVARAQALGFKSKGATSLSSLKFGVTRLMPPDGMSTAEAEALLAKAVPQAMVAVNRKYRLYRTASGSDTGQTTKRAATAPLSGTLTCGTSDHCFGSEIVGWRPELRTCASAVKIGIIDTSVDVTHPAFAHKKIEVKHLAQSESGKPGPDWHGTGVTALLAGDASSGTPGLVPDARFYVADVFHADTDSLPASDTLSMLRAFDWLEAKNVKIINMSLSGPPDVLIKQAIDKLVAQGVVFVAAAGNEGPAAGPSYPAAYDSVIAVTAVGQNLKNYRYANRGSYIDVAAPGVAIWTAMPGSKEGYHSGTSFATPYVTAALAAIYARLPATTTADVLKSLAYKDLGEPGPDAIYGQGLLQAPASCTGNMIAQRVPVPAPVFETSVSASVNADIRPASALGLSASQPEPVEVLPWLTNQSSQ